MQVRSDDQVDFAIDLRGELWIRRRQPRGRGKRPVAEMRQADDELGALRAQLTRASANCFDLVEDLEAVVDASVQEAAERIGDTDETTP